MKLIKWKLLLIAAAGFAFSGTASAQATQNIAVSATVPAFCIFDVATSGTSMTFNLSGVATASAPFDATTTLAWRCTNGNNTEIEIDGGTTTGDQANRAMTDGTSNLAYNLYTDNTYGTIWGDGVVAGTSTVAILGTGMSNVGQSVVYGRVPLAAGQSAEPGTYTDTVQVTILP